MASNKRNNHVSGARHTVPPYSSLAWDVLTFASTRAIISVQRNRFENLSLCREIKELVAEMSCRTTLLLVLRFAICDLDSAPSNFTLRC